MRFSGTFIARLVFIVYNKTVYEHGQVYLFICTLIIRHFFRKGTAEDVTLETVGNFINECIAYIEENAVWLGIVGLAALIILLVFGFLISAGRSRKQTRYLRHIDKQMGQLIEGQKDAASRKASAEEPAEEPGTEDVMASFFEETEIEEVPLVPAAEEQPEDVSVAADMPAESLSCDKIAEKLVAGDLNVDEVFEKALLASETAAPEEPAAEQAVPQQEEISLDSLREALRSSEEETAASAAPEEQAAPESAVARGRSGRLYTREELENQIRK